MDREGKRGGQEGGREGVDRARHGGSGGVSEWWREWKKG